MHQLSVHFWHETAEDVQHLRKRYVGRLVNFQNGGERGLVWVGAHRNPGCPTARSCAPIDAFSWTDGYTTGRTEFAWAPGEPSTWLKNGGLFEILGILTFSRKSSFLKM
ncbi:hypothetical protein B9Z55_027350 [Caenorhabditis nigoni]|uniref:C-type lectin domain-containing protein n=1 Tax=Caenorhabditis nigoni TaxID=1611254 RepID=A0A2G5SGP2_9PELO|nr:hypothetical protein B9Z55_027345 [Caenorhabditis nigoni]PIC14041.1 hypothetical protein B9Z55_027350 [Caenorhabditis nigoni]